MAASIGVLGLGLLASAFASYNIDQDVHLDTVGLLRKYGYPAEAHEVTTADGYILTLHRVPHSPSPPPGGRGRGPGDPWCSCSTAWCAPPPTGSSWAPASPQHTFWPTPDMMCGWEIFEGTNTAGVTRVSAPMDCLTRNSGISIGTKWASTTFPRLSTTC
ncbi:hypothetical protein R5R35_009711 [Gryllus longicercus]|uniref:Partial AB-hydrolase lipase domain-containing protein n=1 Tax=Gryllus longicercus TaxID=2509291 RepID=A0AAN9ZEL0_9ORTH